MTPERLGELADAWGSDLRRWPEAERAAAQMLLERDPLAKEFLARVAELDALLDSHAVAPPDALLVQAMLASVPQQHLMGKRKLWHFSLNWWSGAGVAGVGLAGAAAGALVVAMAVTTVPAPAAIERTWAPTAFDSSGTDWSEE
ncbi:hypothetical protein [Variovorax soli]|uniref:Uncharacterized protein n=1 Tax=Variovorax soli TaxID=376815 RepID=A0ABU1NMR5_9BURK|nr:hypothetical protein [Variovorax soli]MDR6539750.1 hypothetical protein [Variovorax soli]